MISIVSSRRNTRMILIFSLLTLVLMISSVGAVTVEYSNYTEDFVDNNTSDVDSFSDLGTHSTFDNEKASDSTYDTLTEENDGVAGFNLEDFVDAQTNIRTPTDIGTHSSFAEMQDKDATFDTLTEADTGGAGGTTEWYAGTVTDVGGLHWTDEALAADGDIDTYTYATGMVIGDMRPCLTATGFGSGGTGTITQIDLLVRHYSTGLNNDEYALHWITGASSDQVLWAETATNRALDNYTWTDITEPGDSTWTWAEVQAFEFHHDSDKVQGADGAEFRYYEFVLKITVSGISDYDLDLEVGWTGADNNEVNEELCIFAGTLGSENIRVDIWDDVTTNDWVNVKTDLVAGWNNVSLNSGTDYLHDSTFEIRFTDTTGDAVEADTWQVEGVILHTWTDAVDNYELDLEVQFTTISATQYGSTEEWLCIETGTQGAEALKVDIWYSAAWQSLSVDLTASDWNNISISSYLDSATVTIRFKGGTETGDTTTQDTWQIDSVLIKTYSYDCSQTISEVIDISSSTTEAASVSVTNSEVLDISDSESDSIAAGVTINEVISLQESLQHAVDFVVYVYEILEISDTVTTAINVIVAISETIGIAVSLTLSRKMSVTISELIGLADTIAVAANIVVTSFQQIGITATVTNAVSYVFQSNQIIEFLSSVSNSVGGGNDYSVTIYAIIGFSDSITDTVSYVFTSSEVIGISDSLSTVASFIVTNSEVIGFASTITAGATYSNTINVLIELISSVSTSVGGVDYSVTIYAIIGIGDSITDAVSYVVTSSQVIGISDSLSTVASFIVTNSEVIGIAGTVTAGAARSVTINDLIGVGDSLTEGVGRSVTINQVIDLGDSVTTIVNFIYTSNQVIPISESVTTAVSYSFTVNEVIEIISSVSTRIPGAPQAYTVYIYEIIDISSGTSYDVTSSGGPITGTKYQVIINEIIPIHNRKHRLPSTIDLPTLVTIGAAASITILVVEYKTEVFRETYTVAKEWINDSKEKLTDPKPKIPKPKTKPDEKIKLDKKTKKPKVKPEPRTPKPKKIPKKKTPRTPKIDIQTIQKQSKPMQSKITKTGKVKKSMVKSSKTQELKTIKLGKDMERKIKKGGKRPK